MQHGEGYNIKLYDFVQFLASYNTKSCGFVQSSARNSIKPCDFIQFLASCHIKSCDFARSSARNNTKSFDFAHLPQGMVLN